MELRIKQHWRLVMLLYMVLLIVVAVIDTSPFSIAAAGLSLVVIPILGNLRLQLTGGVLGYVGVLAVFKRSSVNLDRLQEVPLGPRLPLIGERLSLRDRDGHKLWLTSDLDGWATFMPMLAVHGLREGVKCTDDSRARLEAYLTPRD